MGRASFADQGAGLSFDVPNAHGMRFARYGTVGFAGREVASAGRNLTIDYFFESTPLLRGSAPVQDLRAGSRLRNPNGEQVMERQLESRAWHAKCNRQKG